MTVGSLFSGIGGFDLGLERAGYEIKWQVEIDPYCQRVLAKHWPHVTRYHDITTVDWAAVQRVDLLCGGFPCQDLSFAGKRAGIDGARSGLWSEYVRAIVQLRPRYVLVENVPGLLTNAYMGRVLGDLAACGYDAEWDCLPASAFGAPHRRDRVWIVARNSSGNGSDQVGQVLQGQNAIARGVCEDVADAECPEWGENGPSCNNHGQNGDAQRKEGTDWIGSRRQILANAFLPQRHRWSDGVGWWEREPQETLRALGVRRGQEDGLPIIESQLGRVAHGIPNRVDRLKGLGNAIVPQIAEALGRMILEADK